jgi:hypothetical protein
VAVAVLGVRARTPAQFVALACMVLVLAAAYWLWIHSSRQQLSIELMKVNLGIGLVFLI